MDKFLASKISGNLTGADIVAVMQGK